MASIAFIIAAFSLPIVLEWLVGSFALSLFMNFPQVSGVVFDIAFTFYNIPDGIRHAIIIISLLVGFVLARRIWVRDEDARTTHKKTYSASKTAPHSV